MSAFQDNLKKFRERLGFSAKGFAADIGIKYTTYANYENAGSEPKYDTLIKIAAALHVSIDDLLGYTVDEWEKTKTLLANLGYRLDRPQDYPHGAIKIIGPGLEVGPTDERELVLLTIRAKAHASKVRFEFLKECVEKELYALAMKKLKEFPDIQKSPADESAGK